MAGGGDPLSGLQDGDGMEDRLPAPPRIPDSAHGLVRATAIADSIGGGSRQDLRQGWYARRAFLADPAALPRQHAHGRRRGPYSLRARTNAGQAVLYASQDRRGTTPRIHPRTGGAHTPHDRRDVPDHGPAPVCRPNRQTLVSGN